MSAVVDAIAGRPRLTVSEANHNGSETPRVNGWSFVNDKPSSTPTELGAPPLTWGTVDSSPLLLGPGDATPNPFQIKEKSKREDLHHRIVDRVAKNKRCSARQGMTGKIECSPIPKFPNSPRAGVGNLTPAAQRLWSKIGSPGGGTLVKTSNGSKAKESGLRHRWTPTPKAVRAQTEA
jgi:protein DGCR14